MLILKTFINPLNWTKLLYCDILRCRKIRRACRPLHVLCEIRVTRLGYFRLLGDYVYAWSSLLKITELAQIFGLLLSKSYKKMGRATFRKIFFTNSSGRPVCDLSTPQHRNLEFSSATVCNYLRRLLS
jgi:hypothetical protein